MPWPPPESTDDYRELVRRFHAGEIDDDRVRCSQCRNGGVRRCAEGILCSEVLRRCVRFEASPALSSL